MSLQTDRLFIAALQEDVELMQMLAAKAVYGTAIALPDEEAENAPLPYIIVSFDGASSNGQSKDDPYDDDTDETRVSMEIAAQTRPQLAEIAERARKAARDYFRKNDTEVYGYDFAANAVEYDSDKPCYWQRLNFLCTTATQS